MGLLNELFPNEEKYYVEISASVFVNPKEIMEGEIEQEQEEQQEMLQPLVVQRYILNNDKEYENAEMVKLLYNFGLNLHLAITFDIVNRLDYIIKNLYDMAIWGKSIYFEVKSLNNVIERLCNFTVEVGISQQIKAKPDLKEKISKKKPLTKTEGLIKNIVDSNIGKTDVKPKSKTQEDEIDMMFQ